MKSSIFYIWVDTVYCYVLGLWIMRKKEKKKEKQKILFLWYFKKWQVIKTSFELGDNENVGPFMNELW